jgi:hypothetical protein
MATMAALVLGMLVSSAKSSYDARKNEIAEMSAQVVNIDRLLARYGPETAEIRGQFRQVVKANLDRIWPSQGPQQSELRPGGLGEALFDRIEFLKPANDLQTITKSQVIPMFVGLRQTQWLMFLKSQQSAIPRPLLVILVSWPAAIFVSFGLFAPRNSTVIVTLALSALGVSSAIFIILEMYTPFTGVLRISPAPILEALSQMQR